MGVGGSDDENPVDLCVGQEFVHRGESPESELTDRTLAQRLDRLDDGAHRDVAGLSQRPQVRSPHPAGADEPQTKDAVGARGHGW